MTEAKVTPNYQQMLYYENGALKCDLRISNAMGEKYVKRVKQAELVIDRVSDLLNQFDCTCGDSSDESAPVCLRCRLSDALYSPVAPRITADEDW